jgi:hypothetical protein
MAPFIFAALLIGFCLGALFVFALSAAEAEGRKS